MQNTRVGAGDQTQKVSSLLRAKSGKDVGAGPAVSSQAERAAEAEQSGQMAQLRSQAGLQGQALMQAERNIGTEEQAARRGVAIAQQQQQQQVGQQEQRLLGQAGREQQGLQFDRDKAAAEQRASERSLADRRYIDNLRRTAQVRRWDNSLGFRTDLLKQQLGNNTEILRQVLSDRSDLLAQGRLNTQELAKINLDHARQMANNAMSDARAAGMISAAGGLASAGISTYGQAQKGAFNSEYQQYVDDGGTLGYSSWQSRGKGNGSIG